MENKSYRVQHRFWLDIAKDDEYMLAERLAEKKAERQYTATLRNALRLYFSLAEGDTSILDDLFPFARNDNKTGSGSGGNGASKADITRLEQMLASLTANDMLMRPTQSASFGTGPKPMSVPQFDLPRFDDDDDDFALELQPIKDTGAAQNFINSMIALQ